MNPLKRWFATQSLAVKLLLTLPLLLAAVLWSLVPEDTTPAASGTATNRPVVSADAPAAQATIAPHQEPRQADTGLSWVSALRTIVSIVVVLGLIVLSARGLKYVMANTGQLPGAGGTLKILDTTYLPAPNGRGRAAIHLLEAPDGRQLLVGATEASLTLLAEYDERTPVRVGTALEATEMVASPEPARPARFDEVLARLRQSARTLEQAS